MIVVGNRIEFATAYLGVLRAQGVAVPVNPRSAPGEIAWMIADSGTRLVVVDDTALDVVRAALVGLVGLVGPVELGEPGDVPSPAVAVTGAEPGAGEMGYADLRADVVRAVPPLPDPEKLAALLYTPGTSGRPGAAMLSHRVKGLVVVSGFNVYPSEVEDVIREVDGVADAAVIGVPDEHVARPYLEAAVRAHAVLWQARFKQPTRIEIVDELPRTVAGRVQKGRLRGLERRRVEGLLQ